MPVKYVCPKCGSENMQKASVIYEAGTTTGIVTGVAMDGDGDMGFGMGRSKRSSLLAARLAPPAKPSCGWGMFWALAAMCGGLAIYILNLAREANEGRILSLGIAVALSLVFLIVSVALYIPKVSAYPARLKAWGRQWYCLKCGSIWIE